MMATDFQDFVLVMFMKFHKCMWFHETRTEWCNLVLFVKSGINIWGNAFLTCCILVWCNLYKPQVLINVGVHPSPNLPFQRPAIFLPNWANRYGKHASRVFGNCIEAHLEFKLSWVIFCLNLGFVSFMDFLGNSTAIIWQICISPQKLSVLKLLGKIQTLNQWYKLISSH